MEILSQDFWCPSLLRKNVAPAFEGILANSQATTLIWAQRCTSDFRRACGKTSSKKHRRNQQRSEEDLKELYDIACVWNFLRPKLQSFFNGTKVEQADELWKNGNLAQH